MINSYLNKPRRISVVRTKAILQKIAVLSLFKL